MREDRELRAAYGAAMVSLAEENERIVAVQADLCGAHGMNDFARRFPDRSFNVGVAEANMAGVAAGLAASGKLPFMHSFATFATRRCFDQIAISICYAGLPVRIVGSDPGVGAELNGGTHMAVEDVGIMRTLPGMCIFEPVDSVQLEAALPRLAVREGPVYIRLFRKKAIRVFSDGYVFRPGKADSLRDGNDVAILASGVCVAESLAAANSLAEQGIGAMVVNIHTVKPLDRDAVVTAASRCGCVVTAENHSVIGGLGSAVAECLAEECPVPMQRVGLADRFGEVGQQDYLMQAFGLSAAHIEAAAARAVARKQQRRAA